jgi:hypothetical protein
MNQILRIALNIQIIYEKKKISVADPRSSAFLNLGIRDGKIQIRDPG